MTAVDELKMVLNIMHKYNLPLSPILEYSINERIKELSSDINNSQMEDLESCGECVNDKPPKTLSHYLEQFNNLSTGPQKPHKAVLLLSIINMIEDGVVIDNKILLDKNISSYFGYLWNSYKISNHVPSVWIPFWYLKSESFWHFQSKTDETILKNIMLFAGHPTLEQMKKVIKYAYLDEELFLLMTKKEERQTLSNVLISKYLKIK